MLRILFAASVSPAGIFAGVIIAGIYSGVLATAMIAQLPATLCAAEPPAEPALAPLPVAESKEVSGMAELGKLLFFDPRLSGDGTTSCATCHKPAKAFIGGEPLEPGYPGSKYFRNTPTVINAGQSRYLYWDGRLAGSDLPTLVRDHIAEAHFMQADGRLVIERIRQTPQYAQKFAEVAGGEPTYGRILNAVAAYLRTLRSHDAPFDKHLRGDKEALSEPARAGMQLFTGKANCVRCHNGPLLTDNGFHNLGLKTSASIFKEPQRHITFRRFFRTFGVSNYANLRTDLGLYSVTKRDSDRGKFRTPSLREVARTAPYMHDGSLATLQDVVAFYNRGGGDSGARQKDSQLTPLGLTGQEQSNLVEFLKSLDSPSLQVKPVTPPPYKIRPLGDN